MLCPVEHVCICTSVLLRGRAILNTARKIVNPKKNMRPITTHQCIQYIDKHKHEQLFQKHCINTSWGHLRVHVLFTSKHAEWTNVFCVFFKCGLLAIPWPSVLTPHQLQGTNSSQWFVKNKPWWHPKQRKWAFSRIQVWTVLNHYRHLIMMLNNVNHYF